ncbi:hypothetical protein [Endozoicomonas sp. 4G]|uniref:hypothetical protein n=1 Tax=Endozoicomonas sp. 4G TaxID=2872754 RepID=UPI0020788E9E|nr:hypothetical protein [Endozoicomonas sp. 4G]
MKNKKFLILMNVALLILGGPIALFLGSIASVLLYKLGDSPTEGADFSGSNTGFDHSGRDSGFDDDSFTHNSLDPSSSSLFEDDNAVDYSSMHSFNDDVFSSSPPINPATGLPMMDDSIGGIDVGGSPYGTNMNDSLGSDMHDSFSSSFDDSFGSSYDDSFSSGGGINNDW